MPKSLSIFLKTPTKLDDVAALLARILGHALVREESDVGPRYRSVVMWIEMVLYDDHGLEDDCGVPFTEFNHQLNLVPLVALQPEMVAATYPAMYGGVAAWLADRLSLDLDCPTMLVENLQRIVSTFHPKRPIG